MDHNEAANKQRLWVGVVIKIVMFLGVSLWLGFLYALATSELSMIRQLLGCMILTMVTFGALSMGVKWLKRYENL